jgi:glutathione S-transferase
MAGVYMVIMLALIEYMALGFNVGRARAKCNIKAPAPTGDPIFERHYRVHQNTMEQLIIFIPAMIVFCRFVSARWAVVLGLLFLIARAVYAVGYTRDPERRTYGAGLTFVVNAVLIIGSMVGLLIAL